MFGPNSNRQSSVESRHSAPKAHGAEHETIRSWIFRKRRPYIWIQLIGLAIMVCGFAAPPIFGIGLLIMIGGTICVALVSCPRCHTKLPAALPMKSWLTARAIEFCPYCGIGMDAKLTTDAPEHDPFEAPSRTMEGTPGIGRTYHALLVVTIVVVTELALVWWLVSTAERDLTFRWARDVPPSVAVALVSCLVFVPLGRLQWYWVVVLAPIVTATVMLLAVLITG